MTKQHYPKRKYGGDRRSYKKVAGTFNDLRCNPITQINKRKPKCVAGTIIVAEKGTEKDTIKMCCGCNISYETAKSTEYNMYDAIGTFNDNH